MKKRIESNINQNLDLQNNIRSDDSISNSFESRMIQSNHNSSEFISNDEEMLLNNDFFLSSIIDKKNTSFSALKFSICFLIAIYF